MFVVQMHLNVSKKETNKSHSYVNIGCVLQPSVTSIEPLYKFCLTIGAVRTGQESQSLIVEEMECF